jgi:hypothetical protein
MDATNQPIEVRKLSLTLQPDSSVVVDREMADAIRALPGVLRVELKPHRHEIEIWFKFPTLGLMYQIRTALKDFQCDVVTGQLW